MCIRDSSPCLGSCSCREVRGEGGLSGPREGGRGVHAHGHHQHAGRVVLGILSTVVSLSQITFYHLLRRDEAVPQATSWVALEWRWRWMVDLPKSCCCCCCLRLRSERIMVVPPTRKSIVEPFWQALLARLPCAYLVGETQTFRGVG